MSGELKKRIFGLFGYPQNPELDPEDEPFANDLNKILDEALKDLLENARFLKYNVVIDLEKFKKWFGDTFDISMPQVTGGCIGHIDLSKLKDLEKE
jgi:hypothetical protein